MWDDGYSYAMAPGDDWEEEQFPLSPLNYTTTPPPHSTYTSPYPVDGQFEQQKAHKYMYQTPQLQFPSPDSMQPSDSYFDGSSSSSVNSGSGYSLSPPLHSPTNLMQTPDSNHGGLSFSSINSINSSSGCSSISPPLFSSPDTMQPPDSCYGDSTSSSTLDNYNTPGCSHYIDPLAASNSLPSLQLVQEKEKKGNRKRRRFPAIDDGLLLPNPELHTKQKNGQKTLWFFMLELLVNPNKKEIIVWTGKRREFKIVDAERFRLLWGSHNERPRVKWTTILRILRGLFDTVLLPVPTAEHKGHNVQGLYQFITEPSVHLNWSEMQLDEYIDQHANPSEASADASPCAVEMTKRRRVNNDVDSCLPPSSPPPSVVFPQHHPFTLPPHTTCIHWQPPHPQYPSSHLQYPTPHPQYIQYPFPPQCTHIHHDYGRCPNHSFPHGPVACHPCNSHPIPSFSSM